MNIIIINNSSPFDGSGVVGLDLFKEFQKRGHNKSIWKDHRNCRSQ